MRLPASRYSTFADLRRTLRRDARNIGTCPECGLEILAAPWCPLHPGAVLTRPTICDDCRQVITPGSVLGGLHTCGRPVS